VAGVPPDYFSKTGQLWGNPLYNWETLKASGYNWWMERLSASLEQVDLVRLDHFRGFEAYWRVAAGMPTAEVGVWTPGPGADFLTNLREVLGGLPLIAEDLGVITPAVEALRDDFHLPGMKILQFAFGGAAEDRFLPHTYEHNCVVYTGTHDNDTTRGWYASLDGKTRDHIRRYLRVSGGELSWDFIRTAYASVANLAVIPLQDLFGFGSEARFNLPGTSEGNWQWRYRPAQLEKLKNESTAYLREIGELYGRLAVNIQHPTSNTQR
jgi:4-alpha-glucanotransferase